MYIDIYIHPRVIFTYTSLVLVGRGGIAWNLYIVDTVVVYQYMAQVDT